MVIKKARKASQGASPKSTSRQTDTKARASVERLHEILGDQHAVLAILGLAFTNAVDTHEALTAQQLEGFAVIIADVSRRMKAIEMHADELFDRVIELKTESAGAR